jgi:acyl-CoA thioesterase-1
MADQPALFQADQLHPVAAAQPRLLDNVWPAVQAALKAK